MPESKFGPKSYASAVKTFTDRVEPVSVFKEQLLSVIEGKTKHKCLVFYGVGGVGKTRLITELMTDIENRSANKEGDSSGKIIILHISMDVHEYDSPVAALIGLRKQITSPCILFDYALARYFSLIGKTADQIRQFIPKDSVWWDVLGEMLSVVHVPIGLLDRIVVWSRERRSEQFNLYRNEIEEVDSIIHDPSAIAERLPHLLGIDISIIARSKHSTFVVFIDSYESIFKRSTFVEGNTDPEEFIREFLVSSENVLFVIGSREFLRWGEKDPDWNSVLDQHILEFLSPEDSEYFLRQVPIKEDDIIKSIVATCKGLPLYLDLCVEIYKRKDKSHLNPADFLIPTREIIARFLNHIDKNERDLVISLSYLHFFNFDIFEQLIKELSIPISVTSFSEIIEHSFVKRLDDFEGLFKIHDNFYEYVTGDPNRPNLLIEKIFMFAVRYLYEHKSVLTMQELTILYSSTMSLIRLIDRLNPNSLEPLLGISLFLLENGYWSIVGNSLGDAKNFVNSDTRIRFLYAIYLLKIGKLAQSNELLLALKGKSSEFGSYSQYLDYYVADVTRIMGDYDGALGIFNKISSSLPIERDKQLYLRTMRQIGDLTFVKSGFKKALSILEKSAMLCDSDSMELAEITRIMGHIYRFNFHMEEATANYMRSFQIAQKIGSISLEGMLYNNLTEVFAWIDPAKALEYGDKSLTINRKIVEPVEEGKTLAAMSIAKAFKNESDAAAKLAHEARELQFRIGYRGGVLFAEIALGVCKYFSGESSDLMAQVEKVKEMTENLKGERFSILPLLVFVNDKNSLDELKNEVEWLNFPKTLNFLKELPR